MSDVIKISDVNCGEFEILKPEEREYWGKTLELRLVNDLGRAILNMPPKLQQLEQSSLGKTRWVDVPIVEKE